MGRLEEVIRQKAGQVLLSLVVIKWPLIVSAVILRPTTHSGRSGNAEPESMLYILS